MSKQKRTLIDEIGAFVFKVGMFVLLLLAFNSIDINVTIVKKRNSLLSTVGDTVEQGYSTFKTVKNLIK